MSDKGSERRGLGRGLSALMGDINPGGDVTGAPAKSERKIPVEDISPNPDQPRRRFSEAALDDLSRSIREKGIIQPLILRETPNGRAKYEIVAGERRWRAAQLAQIHEVPAIVRAFSDEEAMEVAIIENIQRDDLNAIEEADSYRRLMDVHQRTQEELAKSLGKSRSHIANMLRLVGLPEEIRGHVEEGRLSAGHARALITSEDPIGHAKMIISKGLSVRDAEKLAKGSKAKPAPAKRPVVDADTKQLEDELSASVGVRIAIAADANGQSGKLIMSYKNLDELDDLCRRLSNVRAGEL